jgi:hypothetical protein
MQLSHFPGQPISTIRIEDLLGTLKTGDLIFTKAKNTTSKLQQYFFGSYINHVAMIFKTHDGNFWVWDTGPSVGAYMTPLHEFIRHNWLGRTPPAESPPIGFDVAYINPQKQDRIPEQEKSFLFVRRLLKPVNEQKILAFIQQNLGRPYSYRFWMSAANIVTGYQMPFDWTLSTDSLGMFCSELLVHTLASAGEINASKTPAPSMLPKHFWMNEVGWEKHQTLLGAERLIGKMEHIIFSDQSSRTKLKLWLHGVPTEKEEEEIPAYIYSFVEQLEW